MRLLPACAGLASLAALTGALGAREPDPVRSLEAWLERLEHPRGAPALHLEDLQLLLAGLGRLRAAEPERTAECDRALLDVAARGWLPRPEREALSAGLRAPRDPTRGEGPPPPSLEQLVGLAGDAAFSALLDRDGEGALASWLAGAVLGAPSAFPPEHLSVAADLLAGRYLPPTQSALFGTALAENELEREAAFRALAGWGDPVVDRFFLAALERGRVPFPLALRHLETARERLEPASAERLRAESARRFASADWRDALRAVQLAALLDAPRAAPLLIESLALWKARRERGRGSPRVEDALVRVLQGISGRSIGPFPERWTRWWMGVQEGRIEPPGEGGEGEASAATFFGLRIASDRVLFVIDRSGSMAEPFATSGRSRYAEAVRELAAYADALGPEARFGVTVFHGGAERWRPGLATADEAGVKAARRWLEARRPDGGTQLLGGLALALGGDRPGPLDPARVEADTVVVLCDGDTAEGPAWVRPWLERNAALELVFHCVQIGGQGDGTLQLLAEGTGGDFVRVGG